MRFVYGIDGELMAEYASSNFAAGNPTVEYAYRGGEVIVEARSAGNTWRITDSLGSVRTTLDASGNLVNRTDHSPFGEELGVGVSGRTGTTGTRPMFFGGTAPKQKFTGLERDTTTSYDHTLWRKMDSVQGRWTSPDPYAGSMSLVDPQSFNRYAYVGNDPSNAIDPSGLVGFRNRYFLDGIEIPQESGSIEWLLSGLTGGMYTLQTVQDAIDATRKNTWLGSDGQRYFGNEDEYYNFSEWEYSLTLNFHLVNFNFAKSSFQQVIDSRVKDASGVLAMGGDCAKFFGPNAQDALNALAKVIKPERLGDSFTGIRTTAPSSAPNGKFRIPSKSSVNITGGFLSPNATNLITGYTNGQPMSQILSILHEVAHLIKSGDGWLIPNDAATDGSEASKHNSSIIANHCAKDIQNYLNQSKGRK